MSQARHRSTWSAVPRPAILTGRVAGRSLGVAVGALIASSNALGFGFSGVDLQFINDSNPAKAEFARDIEATSSIRARVTGNLLATTLADSDNTRAGLSLNASASYEHNADIVELGESRYRLSFDGFRESRRLWGQPFFRFGLGATYVDAETSTRDGPIIDASASVNVQPAPFFDATLGLNVAVREADEAAFDTTKTTVFLTSNFSPAPRIVLRAGLRFVAGDETSSATPTLNIVNNAKAIEPDPAFGGFEANRFAYLIDANSAIAEAGIGYDLTASTELNLLYRYVNTSADGDIGYDRNMIEFTLSFNF